MSAYANVAQALGAEVSGWDVRDTIFMSSLEGIEVDLGGEPSPPEGWEIVVSTAHLHRCDGIRRADFLAELVAAQPAIAVGGAHGKTTTAAMIAFVLAETGRDPAWIIGGIVPAARRKCRSRRRLARRRGRRIRPLDRIAGAADRGDHEHRARPPRDLCVGGRVARFLRRVARDCPARRAQLGVAGRRSRARGARRSQPPERRCRSCRARARRGAPAPRPRRRSCASRASGGGSSSSASAAASRSTTTTATTRPSSR